MSQGRSIRLFLVDGTSNGLLTAEIMNWTGHVLTGPRSKLAEIVQRPECGRTGIYFLIGQDPENNLRSQVYIGESDDVAKRLKQHNRPEEQNGKDFWEKVCIVTSKDQNLTKAHVKYLESQLISIAKNLGRCELLNGTAHDYGNLPESDLADMAFFLDQIRIILPALGFDFLREVTKPSSINQTTLSAEQEKMVSPKFIMKIPNSKVYAYAQEIDGEFFVLKGSKTRGSWSGTESGYKGLFDQLVADGILVNSDNGFREFSDDYSFSKPSAAAAVVAGRSANGRTEWSVEGANITYAAWQNNQLNDGYEQQNLFTEGLDEQA